MNPILAREIRARFRDKRSFWLVFALTALLCVVAAWIYNDAAMRAAQAEAQTRTAQSNFLPDSTYYSPYAALARQASATGRELFRALALGNALAWLLIAPALTATALAKERERGLLESLWLSPFRIRSQIAGRMAATLFFLFILQLSALPIYGIALLLGGVSPGEVGIAATLIAATALVGTSLGMWCSARSHRPANALGAAFFVVALWSAVAYWQLYTIYWSPLGDNWLNFALAFGHPVILMQSVLSDASLSAYGPSPWASEDLLTVGLALQIAASVLLLWGATRKASAALPEAHWQERNPMWQRWRAHIEAQKEERRRREEAARLRENVAGALLYELPIERLVRFRDPLLSREVKSRFRLRAGNRVVSVLRFGAFLIAGGLWSLAAFSTTDAHIRDSTGQMWLFGLWGCGMLAMGVMAGSSFTRERESGTWEGLKLSLLRPTQIVRSKWLAPLVAFGYWSAAGWILVPFYIKWSAKGTGIDFLPMIGAIAIIVFSLGAACALGLYISSRAPHSAAGTSWTLAVLLVILAGFPALDSIGDVSGRITNAFFGGRIIDRYGRVFDQDGRATGIDVQELKWRPVVKSSLQAYHPISALQEVLHERETQRDDYYNHNLVLGLRPDVGTKILICLLNLTQTAAVTALLLLLVARRVQKIEEA
ncbi:MAG: ABC transporter permease [Armatimonadetes bacterium]|nr:ABC transporter permease [Armatimonadota bacterium]